MYMHLPSISTVCWIQSNPYTLQVTVVSMIISSTVLTDQGQVFVSNALTITLSGVSLK